MDYFLDHLRIGNWMLQTAYYLLRIISEVRGNASQYWHVQSIDCRSVYVVFPILKEYELVDSQVRHDCQTTPADVEYSVSLQTTSSSDVESRTFPHFVPQGDSVATRTASDKCTSALSASAIVKEFIVDDNNLLLKMLRLTVLLGGVSSSVGVTEDSALV